MPIVKVLRAECDGQGCDCRSHSIGATAMLFKRRLAGRGWVVKGRKCYCPACAEKGKVER